MTMYLLTLTETARRLSVPEGTLRQWVREGTAPPSTRIGKRRYFRDRDVAAWIEERFQPSTKSEEDTD